MFAPLSIGNLKLDTNLLLAPMSGYTHLAFRLVARGCGGVGLASTDLLCPQGLLRAGRKTLALAATDPADHPLAMQLYGSNPHTLADAARWSEDHGADVIDINMGCPADKIIRRNAGARLLCDVRAAVKLAEQVRRALRHAPLTAKIRLGWDEHSIVAPELARSLEDVGVAAVTVHGRTAVQQFSGSVSLDGIAAVVAAVRNIPIIGNGDVACPEDALRMLRTTGCAGVMIGREALSAPWIFNDTWELLQTGKVPPPPTLRDKCRMIRAHFFGQLRNRGQRAAVNEMRKRISWYAKHLNPCRPLREGMRVLASADEFDRIMDEFIAQRAKPVLR